MKILNLYLKNKIIICGLIFTLLIGLNCDEGKSDRKSKRKVLQKQHKTELDENTGTRTEKHLFERLNCNPPEIDNLKIIDSIYSHFGFKIAANNEKLDSIFVTKHKFIYDSNLNIEVGFYSCSSKYSDDYLEICNENQYVNDSIRSYIKIGNKKMFIDLFFEKIFNKAYFYFNHFSDQYKLKKLRFSTGKYYIAFFPCYYFGAQSWFDYLPILFEIKDDQLSQIFIMPGTIYSDNPYQFTDYNSDGEPEWIGIDEFAKLYEINPKKISVINNFKSEIQALDQGYVLKDTIHKWPCTIN